MLCFKVALGGGRRYFQPINTTIDPEYGSENHRTDGRDLIDEWLQVHNTAGFHAEYVWNKTEFEKIDPVTTDKLLGNGKT